VSEVFNKIVKILILY